MRRVLGALVAIAATVALASAPAEAAQVAQEERFTASDGVTLQATVTKEACGRVRLVPGSRLLFPTLPGSDLQAALAGGR